MKKIAAHRLVISMVFSFVFMSIFPAGALAEEEYVFERMWPVLEQPWYFYFPRFVATDNSGNVYVGDTSYHRIQKFTSSGVFVTKWGSYGTGNGEFDNPFGIAIDGAGNVYVADTWNHRIQKFTSSGVFVTKWGSYGTGDGEFDNPYGIAIDASGNVYVADWGNHCVQKFTSSGTFITKWGSEGSGDGELFNPNGIAINSAGNVYVADEGNDRIQKFTSAGVFVTKWGSGGTGDGEFDNLFGIVVDGVGNVYVADRGNSRIQKFTSAGEFVTKWGSYGTGDGEFDQPYGIAIDGAGNVYVADVGNLRIQKFTSSGSFKTKWCSEGIGDGEFHYPNGIAINSTGNVYVVDTENHRIQKSNSSGTFMSKWGSYGTGDGEFRLPNGIAIDGVGNVYVADQSNHRIQKFSSSGAFVTKWGNYGTGDGEFEFPKDIAVDNTGNIYVSDGGNDRIQKFSSSGTFITKWGSEGIGDGEFNRPLGITINDAGNVYVTDWGNHRIQKFSSSGTFITKWGSEGIGDGELYHPIGIATNGAGNVYVADTWNHRIQKFSRDGTFITSLGALGSAPGLLNNPTYLTVSSKGKIYVAGAANHRIQVFSPSTKTTTRKAIIVAGSGPYETNELWDATQVCLNHAYRALTYQGYDKDTIQYLSADTDLDLDNDGTPDVDADATNANLEFAVKTWAQNADNLLIYMVGHGGEGTFRMREFELLNASDFDGWLDAAQQTIPGFVAIVYDACSSGSFLDYLIPAPGKTRILATSASSDQRAAFLTTGATSFGYQFFSRLFDGGSFYESYMQGKECMEVTLGSEQNAQIEANGNTEPNEKADKEAAAAIKVGIETAYADDIPAIESVSSPQVLIEGDTSATIYAQNVIDADGIQEVFAVIRPPDYGSGSSDEPVTNLPTINLKFVGNNRYEGNYDGFTVEGVYNVAVFARDGKGTLSLPVQTSVTVPSSTDCLAVDAYLGIKVLCAEYNGNEYGFTLDFYRNPDDSTRYYWKIVMSTLTTGEGADCILFGSDLSMPMDCVSYNGTQYGFTLRFYNNPYDPSGYYWKMDISTLVVK